MNQELSIQYMYTVRISVHHTVRISSHRSLSPISHTLVTGFVQLILFKKKKKTPFFDTKGKNDSRNLNKMWDLIPESGRYFT